ncbi:MAG TPA: 4Fe-4S dicluster domain-containing protein [Chlorobaculum sp.]|uniref:Iron-sulfur cluster-binding protein n=1 Tax=Chlorobaculum tepidum (strain ATCC 49652 / DSM 12025 / NBRC 103806 / TLS) TaxID=194439 RepID=Q8KBT2_CHLTE|nr:4Fe-4S binding protein [Chlorobaculum tepidum]AAM72925.1 iron-sulfur cluster-binding protein [Chlorobaculum tepidum TLS]HBU22553.1 4Fe-4S dicluster domain-containing protein [Chlorobaculum sp.]
MKRQIITIDEKKCTGCGDCIPACPEGALQVIDGKARLVSDLFCDGLGACIGHCPTGAMQVETREAEPYDERRVMAESIVKAGPNVIAAHLCHLRDHGANDYLREALAYLEEQGIPNPLEQPVAAAHPAHVQHGGGCPGSRTMDFRSSNGSAQASSVAPVAGAVHALSELRQWPVQLHLVSPIAPCFEGSDLLLAADCVAFAAGDFHSRLLRGKTLAVACPKLDSGLAVYVEKLAAMIDHARINTITVAIMEVPCCGGLLSIVEEASRRASRKVPVKKIVIGVQGDTLSEEWM